MAGALVRSFPFIEHQKSCRAALREILRCSAGATSFVKRPIVGRFLLAKDSPWQISPS